MAGFLDFLTGNSGASPWGALYPSPMQGEADQAQQARDAAAAILARRFRGASHAPAPETDAPAFGANASPFSFAGPGSMTGIDPATFAPPAAPAPAAPAAPSADATGAPAVSFANGPAAPPPVTDVSSSNRAPAPAAPVPQSAPAPAAPAAAPSAPAAAPMAAPFSFGGAGAGIGDRLMKATRGFIGNLHSGPIGALAGGLGSLVTGQDTDPGSISRGHVNATGQALLKKGVPAEDVQAAINNPALMTALIGQYYGKDKFKVVQTGENDGTKAFSVFNETDGTMKPIASDASERGGTVTGPDGKPIVIPPGVNRKEFINHVSRAAADVASGKQTEAQAKASSFAARMQQAESLLTGAGGGLQNEGMSLGNKAAGNVPMVGNYLQSKEYQQYKTAASAFVTAMLRQESGAAINKSEFDRYEKELFPQPGDDPSVVTQKAQMRAAAVEQMRRSAGPGYKSPGANRGTVNVGGQSVGWSVN